MNSSRDRLQKAASVSSTITIRATAWLVVKVSRRLAHLVNRLIDFRLTRTLTRAFTGALYCWNTIERRVVGIPGAGIRAAGDNISSTLFSTTLTTLPHPTPTQPSKKNFFFFQSLSNSDLCCVFFREFAHRGIKCVGCCGGGDVREREREGKQTLHHTLFAARLMPGKLKCGVVKVYR